MRKTLTAVAVLLAAGSLAACDKMPWAKEKPVEPAPVSTPTEPSAPVTTDNTTATPDATTPAAPTAK